MKSERCPQLVARLKEERWSVPKLARKIGMSDQTLRQKLSGMYEFKLWEAFKIAEVLHDTVENVFAEFRA